MLLELDSGVLIVNTGLLACEESPKSKRLSVIAKVGTFVAVYASGR
jgi:hypothetical protein